MATVVALVPDLLFGSRLEGLLIAGGHEVELVASGDAAQAALDRGADVLVVDLITDTYDGVAVAGSLSTGEARLLGFFAHTAPQVRERALAAGFDQVVPRSRINREGVALVTTLAPPARE